MDNATIARIKDLPVSKVASLLGLDFRRKGADFCGLSPFNEERTPSCYYVDRKGIWKDFSSGKGGDCIRLVQEIKNLRFLEAAAWIEERIWGKAPETARIAPRPLETPLNRKSRIIYPFSSSPRRIWEESRPIQDGDPVSQYLFLRGIEDLPPECLTQLRFHPSLRHPQEEGTFPGMVCALRDSKGKLTGIQRLYLDTGGRKAGLEIGRATKGKARGSAVQLMPPGPVMCIAEGIESALSAWILDDKYPVWAATGHSILDSFEPPQCCKLLFIYADNDRPGKEAAKKAAKRLAEAGLIVRIRVPEKHGDYNDMLTASIYRKLCKEDPSVTGEGTLSLYRPSSSHSQDT